MQDKMISHNEVVQQLVKLVKSRFGHEIKDIELSSLILLVPDVIEYIQTHMAHFRNHSKKKLVIDTCIAISDEIENDALRESVKMVIPSLVDSLIYAYKSTHFLKKQTKRCACFSRRRNLS